MRWLSVVAIALAAGPTLAGVPVSYDADLRALKKNLRFGDTLVFSLYSDPECTGTAHRGVTQVMPGSQ